MVSNSAYGFPSQVKEKKQPKRGYRFPRHEGSRTVSDNQVAALWVNFLLPGETLTRMELDYAIARKDNDNPDQTYTYEFVVAGIPFYGMAGGASDSIDTAQIDDMLWTLFDQVATNHSFGADDNGFDETWMGHADVGMQGEVLFHTSGLAHSDGTSARIEDEIGLSDDIGSRIKARGRKTISRNFAYDTMTLLIGGVMIPRNDANTVFGITELDSSATMLDLIRALETPLESGATTGANNVATLMYGGDRYIEANTRISAASGGFHAHMNAELVIGTPWPAMPLG